MPLPANYGVDVVVLQVCHPRRLYAYWELKPATVAKGRTSLGEEGVSALTALRVFEGNTHSFDRELPSHATDWFIEVHPSDRSWRAALGLKTRLGRFLVLAESNVVRTPPQAEGLPASFSSSSA